MKLLNNKIEENNYITKAEHPKHTIQKYEFRSIQKEPELVSAIEESGIYTPPHQEIPQEQNGISKEQFDSLLQAYQSLETKMQTLLQELQTQKQDNALEEIKASAYQQGVLEATQKTKDELEEQVQKQKEVLIFSIQSLEETLQEVKNQLSNVQNDLSVIALDLTKEVILKEVSQNSQEIALSIAKELLRPLEENTKLTLKVNPNDLPYLQEKLSNLTQIEFKADLSISKGGVIVQSPNGNFDGTILSRYRQLKQSLLDEKGL